MSAPQTSGNKMLLAMSGIGTLCALLIVLTYEGTLPRIERLKAEALQQAIFKVVPGITTTQTFYLEGQELKEGEAPGGQPEIYAGYNASGALLGVALPAEGQGYADKIKILYGYNPTDETVIGFYVLETKETPGLGDKIEKDPNFLANFDALDVGLNDSRTELAHAVVTVKSSEKTQPWQVDGITGATISSRAIGDIINESMSQWAPLLQSQLTPLMSNPNQERL